MSLVRFNSNPFGFFDQAFDHRMTNKQESYTPAVNVKENENGFHLEVAAPGIDKKDFKVSIDQDTLSIGYEKKESSEEKDEKSKYHRREFSFRSFKRAFTLPRNVDKDQINANYENGILRLNIPKKEKAETQKTIDIS